MSAVVRYTEAGRLDRLTSVTDPMSLPAPYQQMSRDRMVELAASLR